MADQGRLDSVLHKLNWHGRYQLTQLALTYVSVLPGSLNILSYVFVGYDGPHQCRELTNSSLLNDYTDLYSNHSSVTYRQCQIDVTTNTSQGEITDQLPCIAGNSYSEQKSVSLVSDLDLVCERASLSELTQTVFVLGQAFGAIVCSSMSDRFGRKFTYIFNVFMLMVAGLVLSFAPNYAVFVSARFFAGIFQQGTDLTIATMILESVPTEKRFIAGTFGSLLWGTALVTLAPLAYLLRDYTWRYLQLAVSLTALYSVILPFTLDETLRWLEANGKTKEIERLLRKAAKQNDVPVDEVLETYWSSGGTTQIVVPSLPENIIIETHASIKEKQSDEQHDVKNPIVEAEEVDERHHSNGVQPLLPGNGVTPENGEKYTAKEIVNRHAGTRKYNLLDIMKNKMIFKNALIVWYIWIADSLVYYGLYMTSSALAGNRYLNYFLNAVAEVPSGPLIYLTLERFGRKGPSLALHAIAGLSLLGSVFLKTFAGYSNIGSIFSTILALVGKCTISTGFGIMFIYTPELFPTNLRNVGLGAASAVSRLGGMLSPFAGTLEKVVAWGPGVIFSGMALLAGFIIQFLPETRGHELPQTMEEISEWYRTNLPSKKQKGRQPNKKPPADIVRKQ